VTPSAGSNSDLGATYNDRFYDDLAAGVLSSADVIAPLVAALLHPQSVLDVGCGRGTWLAAFRREGVKDLVGVDGSHVDPSVLEIEASQFEAHDLRNQLDLGREFDLVVSLEVAEHLDRDAAEGFVDSLVRHGRAVLFSAAIPGQGGAGHVNEQWPSFWAGLFEKRGYVAIDAVRPIVWSDERVAFWYAQNSILYVDGTRTGEELSARLEADAVILDLVHPALLLEARLASRTRSPASLRDLLRAMPSAAIHSARHRFRRRAGRDS
jgi:SAM-dependent methyltransferase